MQAASGEAAEVQMLRLAWAAARPAARTRFLVELTRTDSEPAEPLVGRVGWLNSWRLSNSMTGPHFAVIKRRRLAHETHAEVRPLAYEIYHIRLGGHVLNF